MEVRFVNLRDINHRHRELTGMSFGIVDDDNQLLKRLHFDVDRRHKPHDNKAEVLAEIYERFALISNNQASLATMHEKPIAEIKVRHELTPVLVLNEQYVQILISDIVVALADGNARFEQPPLCFYVSEDFKIWKETAKLDEQRCEDLEVAHVARAARLLAQQSRKSQPESRPRSNR